MPRSSRRSVTALVRPALRLWDRIPIRTQGRITVALPLVAVFVSAYLAIMGNHQRIALETDIQRKFEMSAALGDLTTSMVNAETGVRGYLLTGQSEFLQPFDQATAALPATMARLNELALAEPGEKPREDELQRIQHLRTLTGEQLDDLAYQRLHSAPGARDLSDSELRGHLAYGKGLMDQIRADVDAMQDEQGRLLNDRIADINTIRVRDYASAVVALIAALAMRFVSWYLFREGILRRVDRLTGNVRDLRGGSAASCTPPEKGDKMGELEREIYLLSRST